MAFALLILNLAIKELSLVSLYPSSILFMALIKWVCTIRHLPLLKGLEPRDILSDWMLGVFSISFEVLSIVVTACIDVVVLVETRDGILSNPQVGGGHVLSSRIFCLCFNMFMPIYPFVCFNFSQTTFLYKQTFKPLSWLDFLVFTSFNPSQRWSFNVYFCKTFSRYASRYMACIFSTWHKVWVVWFFSYGRWRKAQSGYCRCSPTRSTAHP